MAEESKGAVFAAMGANAGIALGKGFGGLLTGSAAMLAEAGHSVADTVNQVFLLVGINLSDTHPDEDHPYGYGKEAFFWSFMVAVFIFVAGASFSFFEGTRTLVQGDHHDRTTRDLIVAFGVLGLALVFESVSFSIALRRIIRGARQRGWSVLHYMRESPDLTLKTVVFEDSAGIVGLTFAAAGLGLAEATGNEWWDGLGSIAIGVVLATVAFMLGFQARHLLLGAAASRETREAIRTVLAGFPEIERPLRVLTMQIGSRSVLVTGELALRDELTTRDIEDLIRRIDTRLADRVPEVTSTFWELRSGGKQGRST